MPANGKFLLDANVIIALLEGDDAVLSNLDQAPEVFIPAVALGELFFGAAKSGRPVENTDRVERFAAGRAIVACDLEVAREYGRLKQDLKARGRPLPENDICIAAAAKRHGLVLVTRDRHFQSSSGFAHCGLGSSSLAPATARVEKRLRNKTGHPRAPQYTGGHK
jgi:tRNA(fMet)-specific endonuclease VapC